MACILIIDDEEVNRDVLEGMLSSVRYQVVVASDGNEGIDQYRKSPADLVITDIMMPGKNGLDVIRELRQEFPDVKIIAVAASGPHILTQARAMGANRVIDKPFRMKELLDTVHELLEGGAAPG